MPHQALDEDAVRALLIEACTSDFPLRLQNAAA